MIPFPKNLFLIVTLVSSLNSPTTAGTTELKIKWASSSRIKKPKVKKLRTPKSEKVPKRRL